MYEPVALVYEVQTTVAFKTIVQYQSFVNSSILGDNNERSD
jgi:hypothetical protein